MIGSSYVDSSCLKSFSYKVSGEVVCESHTVLYVLYRFSLLWSCDLLSDSCMVVLRLMLIFPWGKYKFKFYTCEYLKWKSLLDYCLVLVFLLRETWCLRFWIVWFILWRQTRYDCRVSTYCSLNFMLNEIVCM